MIKLWFTEHGDKVSYLFQTDCNSHITKYYCYLRLDRLFLLLDTGSSAVTRKAAAQQLGEVQRLHPHELPQLLKKIFVYLKSPSWDTRIAASQAITAVISNVPQWNPTPQPVKTENQAITPTLGQLKYENFNIKTVLANRHFLTASEGKEFDDDDLGTTDPKERLALQRKALNDKLGLELAAKLGIDTTEIVSAEDLTGHPQSQPVASPASNIASPANDEETENLKQLSSREANRAKRKARQGHKQKSLDGSPCDASSHKKMKKDKEDDIIVESIPDPAGTWPDTAQNWPFESFCDLLVNKLLCPSWEVRGATTQTVFL